MKKTIGICGLGVVGQALENGFKPYHNIEVYDPPKGYDNIDGFVNKCDVIFVSLPTPMKRIKGGETDLTILDNVVGLIASRIVKSHKIIVIKSTIIPGTMSKYSRAFPGVNFVFNPEFLTEDNAIEDFKNQDRIVIASDKFKNSYKIGALYKKIFPGTPIMYTDFKEAEMGKYACNGLLATKVSYANEIYRICQAQNIDYETVKQIMIADRRIGETHLDVPGKDGDFGWGRKCFPKDLNALIHHALSLGYEPKLLECMWSENLKYRKHWDWQDIPGAVSEKIEDYKDGE